MINDIMNNTLALEFEDKIDIRIETNWLLSDHTDNY